MSILLKRLYDRWRVGRRHRQIILASGLFDSSYYLTRYPDVRHASADALHHYLKRGRYEGRAPSEEFDPRFYLDSNPDVRDAGVDPFVHYIEHGRSEKRLASPPHSPSAGLFKQKILDSGLFDPEFYQTIYLDVTQSGLDPLNHYVVLGRQQLRQPSAEFDAAQYLSENPDVQREGVDPLIHYIDLGKKEGRRLHASGIRGADVKAAIKQIRASGLFDRAFYLRQCPVVRDARIDPLHHYVISDYAPFVDPCPSFSALEYGRANPAIRKLQTNPLLHYLDMARHIAAVSRARPNDMVAFEIKAGENYLQRFRFGSGLGDPYVFEAIAEMVCRSPELTIDRITPDVSIILPVFGQLPFVLSCLDSLRRHNTRYKAEVIVADDATPTAEQTTRLQAIPWVRYVRRESNLGFLDNCNDAARLARGRIIVFLNSDTRVADGWLDQLMDSFALFPRAGLVGSALFNSDGTLQEAGGIYWSDGSAWNYGRDDDPDHPKYRFARQVDYVSGASIAVRSEVWRRLNGFDTRYRPAYCEDADLAFRTREAGSEVWVQPLSQVVHYEGKSHGRDLTQGIKRFQTTNMLQFASRWRNTLASHGANGHEPDQEANRQVRDRILVLDAVTPTPDRDSGSFVTVRMLKALQTLGYQVTFIPQHNYLFDDRYTADLQKQGIECLYEPYFKNITDVLDYRCDFDVVLAYRHNVLDQAYSEIRRRMPLARIIFHNVDLHFLREEREAALYGSRAKKISAAVTRSRELELIAQVDCTIVHTEAEAKIIKKCVPVENIVEFRYVSELHRTEVSFDNRHDVMFLGGFNHPPNVDAVLHFAQSIWPALAERLPDCARFLIVGPSAPAEVRNLSGQRIVVTGYVPDLQPYFDGARVFVAPIRYGAGIKGKVIQSLSYGAPGVITSMAAEGIGLLSGVEALIADDDDSFMEAVITLYSDKCRWQAMQTAGYKFVQENCSWQTCLDLTTKALDTADAIWLARHKRISEDRLHDVIAESMGVTRKRTQEVQPWVEPGHFYSPLVDPANPQVATTLKRFDQLELPKESGITLDQDKMVKFFSQLTERYHQLPFVAKKVPSLNYYYENPFFSYGDGIMLGLMTLRFCPDRILEIGSGFSSAAMIDVNDRIMGGKVQLTFVDPFPERLMGLLPANSRYHARILREPVQSVPLDTFRELKANDILFIDSAHVSKMASDVNHLVFNVFPILQPGVVIHVHDVFYPFEYPPAWIVEENRSWNEAYLLRAFLQFNNNFEVLFYNHFAVRKFANVIKNKAPLLLKNGGGSIWMRRVS